MYDIVTIGDVFEDVFLKPCSKGLCNTQIGMMGNKLCLRHGDKILVDEINFSLGGSACNVASGLTKLGKKCAVISAIGVDERGQKIKNKLVITGVDTKYVKSFSQMKTNFSAIIVYKNERTILLYRGLDDYSKLTIPKNIQTKWIYLGPVSVEFSQNYHQLITLAAKNPGGVKLAINPGHRQIIKNKTKLKELIRVASVLILNKQEALDITQLTPIASEKKLLTVLKTYGANVVCLTDGRNGAYVTDGEVFLGGKILPADNIDPTGAGDSFSSGFLASYMKSSDVSQALKWGIVNSGMVTEAYGAQEKLQTEGQIKNLIKKLPELYKL